MFSFTETKAAEYAALMLNKSDRTVRRWRSGLIGNDGVLPESEHGKHQRTGVIWKDEDLNKKATEYIRSNAAVKGWPNLTSIDFCRIKLCFLIQHWSLVSLENMPRNRSHMASSTGFEVLTTQKGIFADGHERSDVIDSRKLFLCKMAKLGFLYFTNVPFAVSQYEAFILRHAWLSL